MTARERDPQGASGPAADLTRIAAIREAADGLSAALNEWKVRLAFVGHPNEPVDWGAVVRFTEAKQTAYRETLARLAPATPAGAATAGDAREADMREALQRIRTITDDPEVDDGDETEILWKAIAAIHQIADDALIVAPESAERSGAAPEDAATAEHSPDETATREERTP